MTTELKPEIKAELDEIVKVIINTVNTEEIYLFGSFARGEEGEDSDFDIFVVLSDEEERILRCCQKISVALFPLKKRGIDILAEYYSKFQNEEERGNMAKILCQEGVKLYGKRKQISLKKILNKGKASVTLTLALFYGILSPDLPHPS